MSGSFRVSAPLAIALAGSLILGASGTAAATHLITGADIKNHSIGVIDLTRPAVAHLHGARGARGKTGPRGTSVPDQGWSGGHVTALQTDGNSTGYAALTGVSAVSDATSDTAVAMLSPDVAITLTSLNVVVSAAPTSGERDFAFSVNGSEVGARCLVFATSSGCSVDESIQVPALSTLALISVVVGSGGAAPADAMVSWSSTAAH